MEKPNKEVTKKLEELKRSLSISDERLCSMIGISKPSLYAKKKSHKWKKSEAFMIMNL